MKQIRQLRSQREAPPSSSKITKPVKKNCKTENNITEVEEEISKRNNGKTCSKVTGKDKEVPEKSCKKTDVSIRMEGEDDKPCPVLKNAMDEMLRMLSKCLENIKIIDLKWKKSKYSSVGTKKARHHVVKQLEAMRNNFEILESDLLECSGKEMAKENINVVTENNEEQSVRELKISKSVECKKQDADKVEEQMDSKTTYMKEEKNAFDNGQSSTKMVSLEKDGKISEKGNERKNGTDTCEQADFGLEAAATGKFANSVDHYEDCSRHSTKTGLPSDDEHSLPDLVDVIKEIISDPDEPMDVEEKMTMIKSLDMENEVPELLGNVRQKSKTEQKSDSKPTDLRDKESSEDLPVLGIEFMERKSNDNTVITHNEDKETSNTRICNNRRVQSASDESSSGSDAEVGKRVQKSSQQQKRMKLNIDSDEESSQGNEIMNGAGKASNKSKEVLDDNNSKEELDKNCGTQNFASGNCGDDGEELMEGDIMTRDKLKNRTRRARSIGNDSRLENDTEVSKNTNQKSSQQCKRLRLSRDTDEDETEKDGNLSMQGKGTDIKKILDNDESEKKESSEVGDDYKNNDVEESAISSHAESSDKEMIKEGLSKSQKKLKKKDTQKSRDDVCETDGKEEEDVRGTDTPDKGPSEGNITDNEAGKIRDNESSSEEKTTSKTIKNSNAERNFTNTVKRDRRIRKSTMANDDEEKRTRSKKRQRKRDRKKQNEELEDDILLGLVRESETSEEDIDEESQRQAENGSEERKEKQQKKGKKQILDSESEDEKDKRDTDNVELKDNKVKNSKNRTDSEHDDEKFCKKDMDSEEDKSRTSESVSCPDIAIKKEEDLISEEDKESCMKLPSQSKEKIVPKKKKVLSVKTENQKAKAAILKSDSEDELEDKPKPRSKKKHYRRHMNTQSKRKSHKKLKLEMTEEEVEELKGKQLDGRCQVLVETLSSEVRQKLEEEEFIYTSDHPELKYPILQRQMWDSDGCDADEEDSDKEFSKLMK